MAGMATGYRHIVRDDEGRLRLERTGAKIIFFVGEHVELGLGAPEIIEAHTDLTPGEVYETLAYYYDHQDEMEEELAVRRRFGEEMERAQGDTARAEQL